MKTTIELPDETFQKAKVLAAQQRTTLRELVTKALEGHLKSAEGGDDGARKARLKRLLGEMQASNTEAMQPLSREEVHER